MRRALDDDSKDEQKSDSPFKRSSIWKNTLPNKLYPDPRKKSSGAFAKYREMPNFKKRNSFSPLKERERRFIESNKMSSGGGGTSIHMFNSMSFVSFGSAISKTPSAINNFPRMDWKQLSFKSQSSQFLDEEQLIMRRNFTGTPMERKSPRNQHSPGKMSIFAVNEFKKNSEDEKRKLTSSQEKLGTEGSKNEEDLEMNSVCHEAQNKGSDDDSILSKNSNKSNHSDGEFKQSSNGRGNLLFEIVNTER